MGIQTHMHRGLSTPKIALQRTIQYFQFFLDHSSKFLFGTSESGIWVVTVRTAKNSDTMIATPALAFLKMLLQYSVTQQNLPLPCTNVTNTRFCLLSIIDSTVKRTESGFARNSVGIPYQSSPLYAINEVYFPSLHSSVFSIKLNGRGLQLSTFL